MAGATVKAEEDSVAERPATLRRSARNKKGGDLPIKQENSPSATPLSASARRSKRVRVKDEEETDESKTPAKLAKTEMSSSRKEAADREKKSRSKEGKGDKEAGLRAKKLKSYTQFANKSPFPDFPRPTPEDCRRAYEVLTALHGERQRPEKVSAPADRAGCGDAPSVLDALVRTILSQNTSNSNSTRAKLDMDEVYGSGDSEERWHAVATGGAAKLEKAIARGGLGGVKSRAIVDILDQVKRRYGTYSLDHLLRLEAAGDDEAAMRELISFRGVGPKTASCVLLFCVGRDSFAVDTHVHRITGIMGWRPPTATRDEAFAHLDARVPDALKYGLHVLLVEHGRKCAECRAGGKNMGRCELRRAFKRGDASRQAEGDASQVKEEEHADSGGRGPDEG